MQSKQGKVIWHLFCVQPPILYRNGERTIVYKNIRLREETENNIGIPRLPSYCSVMEHTSALFKFELPMYTIINGK